MNKGFSFIFILLTISCTIDNQEDHFEDLNVINDTFLELVDTGFYRTPLPPPPYRPLSNSEMDEELSEPITFKGGLDIEGYEPPDSAYFERLRHETDSIYRNFNWEKYKRDSIEYEELVKNPPYDSSTLVILVWDSLYDYKPNEFNQRITTSEMYSQNFNVDSTWRPLVIELIDSVQDERKFPFERLENTGRFNLKPYSYDTLENDRIIGKIWFSKVVFNDSLDRGCYYYGFLCGRLCGWGYIIFVEKKNDKWVIVGARELWVA